MQDNCLLIVIIIINIILECFLKDYVTLNTGVMVAENSQNLNKTQLLTNQNQGSELTVL